MRNLSAIRAGIVGLALTVIALVSLGLPSAVEATSDDGYARDAPSSIRAAAGDDVWECLGDWVDPSDSRLLDIAELSFWALPGSKLLCVQFALNHPFAGSDLTAEFKGVLHVYLDTDCLPSTGTHWGNGLGTDFVLQFEYWGSDEFGLSIWETPSDDLDTWTLVGKVPAYLDESDTSLPLIGAEFTASLVGSPSRMWLDACSEWVSPHGDVFTDWVPDQGYGEVVIRPSVASSTSFDDVPSTYPYANAIRTLSATGIISGYEDNTFRPSYPVWRQHFAKMIVLALDLPVSERDVCRFSDVETSGPSSFYPDNYIAVAASRGITTGYVSGNFGAVDEIKRAQVITMVVRAVDNTLPGLLAAVPSWYTSTWGKSFDPLHGPLAVKAEYNGLLDGLPLGSLGPWGSMSRGEVAQVLSNVLALMDGGAPPQPQEQPSDVVTWVSDGDTIGVRIAGQEKTVRLIGINAPETGQPFAAEAKAALTSLVLGKTVRLEQDVTTIDQYGRLLAYVWVGPTMANAELLRKGLAALCTIPPNVKYTSTFQAALAEAKAAKRGMWATTAASSPVEVVSVHENASGDDNFNLNDEYVTFRVLVSGSLVGYTVKDDTSVADHRYHFPDRVFHAGQVFQLRSGTGVDTQADLYWGPSVTAIWNNNGDTVYVLDPEGHVVESYSY